MVLWQVARSQVVIVVDVAGGAGNIGVAVGQKKSRRAVVELRAQPTVKGVARRAIRRRERFPC